MSNKTGVLLINLGTPDSPSVRDVRNYLFEFLNDPRVIDLWWLKRLLLVNLVIVPFRASKSAKAYRQLWTAQGSPLLVYGMQVRDLLQQRLGNNYDVTLGMRYGKPSIASVLEQLHKKSISRLIVLPLFPQYASASTGSALERVLKELSKWNVIPETRVISRFYDDPGFIRAFAEIGKGYKPEQYDHVLFSYHGLPQQQTANAHSNGTCETQDCKNKIGSGNEYCYRAACYATTRALASRLGLPKEKHSVCFQSRLGREVWIGPYTDVVIKELAKKGIKRLLVFSPAFIADCLETTIEISHEYAELFKQNGGCELTLVESLNIHPLWIDALEGMIKGRPTAKQVRDGVISA